MGQRHEATGFRPGSLYSIVVGWAAIELSRGHLSPFLLPNTNIFPVPFFWGLIYLSSQAES